MKTLVSIFIAALIINTLTLMQARLEIESARNSIRVNTQTVKAHKESIQSCDMAVAILSMDLRNLETIVEESMYEARKRF